MQNKVERINKGKGGKFLLLMFAILAVGSLAACSPEVTHAAPTDTIPVATQKVTPTSTPSPKPTVRPTATPEPTPEMTREEALKKLNITSPEINRLSSLIIFECTLKDGSIRKFMVSQYFKDLASGESEFVCNSVLDDTTFATYTTKLDSIPQGDIINRVDVALVPKFLQGATINQTYGLSEIPFLFGPEVLNTSNPYLKIIYDAYQKYTNNNDSSGFEGMPNILLDAMECANLLLDLVPPENMVWASDYIPDFDQPTPKVK